jgi:hypothetical protein
LQQESLNRGALVNPIILAELSVGDRHPESLSQCLRGLGVEIIDLPWEVSELAAAAYAEYLMTRKSGGG